MNGVFRTLGPLVSFRLLLAVALIFFQLGLSSSWNQAQEPDFLRHEVQAESGLPQVFPASGTPKSKLKVFDATDLPRETQALVASIQGLVNRETPELYLILSRNRIAPLISESNQRRQSFDQAWLDWLKEESFIQSYEKIESVQQLLQHYNIRDVVVIDPKLPAGLNIATMLAGVKGMPMAYPDDVERYDLNAAEDTRGRWKTNIEAYQWAWENLWPEMNHQAIAILSPRISGHLRDYLVSQKLFTFWVSHGDYRDDATTDKDLAQFRTMLLQMPVNIPVLGYPNGGGPDTGIGEGLGVRMLSDHAKFLVPTDWHTNLSIWTGWKSKQANFQQPPIEKLTFDPTKRYGAILVSDGDNMNLWLDFLPTQRYWRSPLRGQFPIAWTMGPAMLQLHAPLLDYYYPSLTSNDSFGCAVSGLGYMYPQHYGEAYGPHQSEILRRYYALTNHFTQRLDHRWFWGTIIGDKGDQRFQQITEELKGMTCILEGYGRQWWRDKPYTVNEIPVFHFLNDAVDVSETQDLVERTLRRQKPQFGIVFIQNWPFDMEKIEALKQNLPADIQWVLPEQLADLYLQSTENATTPPESATSDQ